MTEQRLAYARRLRGSFLVVLIAAALALVIGWAFADRLAPWHWIGYAVCHQLPSHSYWAFGRPLPLCARCTGQYLGAVTAVGFLLWQGRARAAKLPPRGILLTFALMLALWAFDGLNSLLAFVGLPHLYEPTNGLRLVTGTLEGMVLGTVFWPFWADATWHQVELRPVLGNGRELGYLLALEALLVLAIDKGGDTLRYVLGVWSTLGVVFLLSMVFSIILRLLVRQERRATSLVQVLGFVAGGLVLAVGMIAVVDAIRFYLLPPIG